MFYYSSLTMQKMICFLKVDEVERVLKKRSQRGNVPLVAQVNIFVMIFEFNCLDLERQVTWMNNLFNFKFNVNCFEILDSLDTVKSNLTSPEKKLKQQSVALLDFMSGPAGQWIFGVLLLISMHKLKNIYKIAPKILTMYIKPLVEQKLI